MCSTVSLVLQKEKLVLSRFSLWVALVYPVLILVIMTWFFLPSPSVSVVHSGLLFFFHFVVVLLPFKKPWFNSFGVETFGQVLWWIRLSWLYYIVEYCFCFLPFHFLWYLCGLVPKLRILFPLYRLTFF
jgi:hypothetical protein